MDATGCDGRQWMMLEWSARVIMYITVVEGEGEIFVLWRSSFDELESWLGGRW